MTTRRVILTQKQLGDLLEDAAKKGAEKGVKDAFLLIGIDLSTPAGVISAQRDWDHLRGWRKASDAFKRQGVITATGILITGTIGAIVFAISQGWGR